MTVRIMTPWTASFNSSRTPNAQITFSGRMTTSILGSARERHATIALGGSRSPPIHGASPSCCNGAMTPEDFFADHPIGLAVFQRVKAGLLELGHVDVRVTKSQVAFRRDRGFAYLWLPGRHLKNPKAEVVLSIALGREDASSRWKEIVHPATKHWMHHLEINDPDEIDAEVVSWLREAAERA